MKPRIISFLLIIVVSIFPLLVHAQIDPGGDPDVPVDGGLSILLAAGVAYVGKKGYDARKKRMQKLEQDEK